MSTWAKLFGGLLLAASSAAPASATNWVQVDRWDWIDTDSIVRSGNITAYKSVHANASPAITGDPGRRSGIDCATRREYWEQSGQFVAVPDDDPDFDGNMSASDPRYRLLCPNASSSAAPVKPAAAPAKPVPPKTAAGSDLKVCETYGDDKKARIASCTRIIDSPNPRFADLVSAHTNRCSARFLAKEKVDDALADCTRAMTLDPKNFDAVHWRGAINNAAGRLDAAIADFTAAIALNPKDARPHYNRAQVYLRKKDLQKAIADFTADRNLSPGADEAMFRMTLCMARASLNVELETALSDCESAVRLKPKDSYAYERRGLVRLRMGNLKDARADADKALSLDAKNARALYLRALVNVRQGKTLASNDDYSAAKKVNDAIAMQYDDIGLKLTVQPDNAPFCPALTALIKAASERAASKAKANVAMPGATYCMAIDRGYWCTWETGAALAPAKQKAMATAAAACLTGYTRKDSAGTTGPAAEFALAKTHLTVGTVYELETSSIQAAGVAVTIAK
jgi:tetratricopeptide (TPR) repeat protein